MSLEDFGVDVGAEPDAPEKTPAPRTRRRSVDHDQCDDCEVGKPSVAERAPYTGVELCAACYLAREGVE